MQVSYRIEIEQEADGRFLAEVQELPGVLARVQALALRILADRLEQGEAPRGPMSVSFETSAAA